MHRNVSAKDVVMIKEIVSQKNVLDFFKSWLNSNDVSFHVTKEIFDKIEVRCRYYNQKFEYHDDYKFIVDCCDRSKCEVSVLLEGLYSSDEIDALLQFTRLLKSQIGSHLRLNESKER